MIDFWIFPLSTIWGAYHFKGFQAPKKQGMRESTPPDLKIADLALFRLS